MIIGHDRLLNYTLLERATSLLYNNTKPMPKEINSLNYPSLKTGRVKPLTRFLEIVNLVL